MKKNTKHIDSLFRDSVNAGKENIRFNEEHWTAMEYRLDNRDRRRRFLIWFSTLGGAATILILGLMLWPSTDLQNVQHATKSSAVPAERSVLKASKDEDKNETKQSKIPVSQSTIITKRNNLKSKPSQTGNSASLEKRTSSSFSETTISEIPIQKHEAEKSEEVVSETDSKSETVTNPKQEDNTSVQTEEPKATADNSPKKTKSPVQKQKFYYGLVAAPDLSMIKSQRVKNVGYSVGLLIGYKFSNRWAAEAGVQWSAKKYYTDGKYFDKTRTTIPPSIELIYLDGGCGMVEVPLSVRYDFSVSRKSFFASAGLTSYFMKNEEYEYAAQVPGGAVYESHRSYENSGNYLFANTQLSLGYQHNLTSKTKLRIEPYVKVPLKKIGIGNMPITSTGVYIGIVRDIK